MKKVCSIVLILLLTLAAAVPCFASEVDPEPARSSAPMPEETPLPVESSAPEETPIPEEIPPLAETPEEPPATEEPPVPEEMPTPEETPMPEEAQETPPAQVAESMPAADGLETIHVTVPATGHIFLNPYGLPVETAGGTSTEQIVGETLTITNEGNTPVIVLASAVGRISELSSLSYAAQPPQAGVESKEVFLYAEFQDEDGLWLGSYTGAGNQILISEGDSGPQEVLALDAGPSHGVFRLFGTASVNPADPWCSDDAISVTLTFTFTALENTTEDLVEESIKEPTDEPTEEPTGEPTEEVTIEPTEEPTVEPTEEPAGEPAEEPAGEPAEEPAVEPAEEPAVEPTEEPAGESTEEPAGELPPLSQNTPFEEEIINLIRPDEEECVEINGNTDTD